MLQVSRLAPRLLGESAALVRDFVLGRLNEDGGFQDREGRSDLYYTVFGLHCLAALQAAIPAERVAGYLRRFGTGDELDLVHLSSLARSWAEIGGLDRETRDGLARRLEELRTAEPEISLTDFFLAVAARQDMGLGTSAEVVTFLATRRAPDGGFFNEPPATRSSMPATAAALTLLAHVRARPPVEAVRWLEARASIHGGFTAAPGIAMPDLLSTAVILHALAAAERPLTPFVEAGLDFVDSLWTNRGAFHGHWADEELDCEYTVYGLLALGHLSAWGD